MVVQCPKCRTKYRLDDELVSPDGAKVRCSRCKEEFTVFPESTQEPSVAPADESPPASPDLDEDFLGLFDDEEDTSSGPEQSTQDGLPKAGPSQEKSSQQEDELDFAAQEESLEQDSGTGSEDDSRKPEEGEPKKSGGKKGARKRTTVLLIILLLVALGAAGYFYYPQLKPYLPAWITDTINPPPNTGVVQNTDDAADSIENIALVDVRQYFVTNEKTGQIFVIEGKAVNNYPDTRELIKLQASLYDGQGEIIESKQFLCGNTISLFQLQVLSEKELQSALQAKVGVLTNNTNVQPGEECPFMTVFLNPPETVQEFGIKVVEAKEPQN
ncbi:MAG: DUF3426 domain-containing protein [Desulfovibrionales bacterium]